MREIYLSHHSYYIVDNQECDFEAKINKAVNLVSSLVGLPTNRNVFKKFLIDAEQMYINGIHQVDWPSSALVTDRQIVK